MRASIKFTFYICIGFFVALGQQFDLVTPDPIPEAKALYT